MKNRYITSRSGWISLILSAVLMVVGMDVAISDSCMSTAPQCQPNACPHPQELGANVISKNSYCKTTVANPTEITLSNFQPSSEYAGSNKFLVLAHNGPCSSLPTTEWTSITDFGRSYTFNLGAGTCLATYIENNNKVWPISMSYTASYKGKTCTTPVSCPEATGTSEATWSIVNDPQVPREEGCSFRSPLKSDISVDNSPNIVATGGCDSTFDNSDSLVAVCKNAQGGTCTYDVQYDTTIDLFHGTPVTCKAGKCFGIFASGTHTFVATVSYRNLPSSYSVGGTVTGLNSGKAVVLQNNGGDTLTVNNNGGFTFNTQKTSGSSYLVTVFSQPAGQSCTVTSGTGTVSGPVSNIVVPCVDVAVPTYTVGGTVTGLNSGKSVVLQNNGGDTLTVNNNGGFTFNTQKTSGSSYLVTVFSQPAGQSCTVTSGTGTVSGPVSNIVVPCVDVAVPTYTVGGTVTGLNSGKSLVLQNSGGDTLTVNNNGGFTFNTQKTSGSSYLVTVFSQPAGQTCGVTLDSGNISTSNVNNVRVLCAAELDLSAGTENAYLPSKAVIFGAAAIVMGILAD